MTDDPAVQNDTYPTGTSDPPQPGAVLGTLEWCAMMRCFTSPCQAIDRPMSRQGVRAPASERDKRDERLERAGYLLVVYTDRFVRAVAALVLHIGRSGIKQVVARRQIGAKQSAVDAARDGTPLAARAFRTGRTKPESSST